MGELVLGGRYRLEELLGSGGMSVVWRGRDELLGRAVAVKVLNLRDEAARRRILAEAKAAAALSHPNLAQVYDFGEAEHPYLVMELVEGPTLEQVIETTTPADALRICAGVASGLAAAHAAGLVHQDVKPANIIVTGTGGGVRAKLVDFGIAAPAGAEAEELLGTPAYLAPERLRGTIIPASDVYALGVLLYLLLTGRLPWPAETTTQVIRDHVHAKPDPLPDIDGVPPRIAALCMSCLAKDPADRPSAAVVAAALSRVTPAAAEAPVRRTRPVLLAVAALAVAAVVPWFFVDRDVDQPAFPSQVPSGPSDRPSTSQAGLPTQNGRAPTPVTAGPSDAAGTHRPTVVGPTDATSPAPRPSGATSPPVTAAPTTAPAARRFSSEAGTVDAVCDGTTPRLTGHEPAKPWKVDELTGTAVEFRHGNDLVRMAVTCPGGTPTVTVTRSKR